VEVAVAHLIEMLHTPAAMVVQAWSLLNTQTPSPFPTQVVALPIQPQLLAALLLQPLPLAQAMSLGVDNGTLRIS
jgi:hypothetical protein